MAFRYTQANLQDGMNRGIQGKLGMLGDPQETMNEAVRETLTEIRLRSTIRRAALVPNLLGGDMEYAAPADLEGPFIIDIPAQAQRHDGEFTLVPAEQFGRGSFRGDIAIKDANGIRSLLVNSSTPDYSVTLSPLSDDTIGGGWVAFGGVSNVADNNDDFVKGSGSIEFDISAAVDTTAGISNDDLDAFDLTEYIGHAASVFVYARITAVANITNFKLRLGSSATDYYEFTATARNDGTAFLPGWNLLRFDLTSYTTTGSPDVENLNYVAIYMTKTVGKVSEAGYMFNWLVARRGAYGEVAYYSKYGWQTAAGVYIPNSTSPTDLLVADDDEYDLIVKKARVLAIDELDIGGNTLTRAIQRYNEARENYQMKNPSLDKTVITSYHDYDRGGEVIIDPRSY